MMLISILLGILIQIAGYTTGNGAILSFTLLSFSLILIVTHVVIGPTICEKEWGLFQEE